MPLQHPILFFCDNSLKSSSAFECTQLQYFDVCYCHSHSYSGVSYRKIEQKTTGQDLSILLRQCLKETLYQLCWPAAPRNWLFLGRAFPTGL